MNGTAPSEGVPDREVALALEGVTKRFGPLTALDGASLHVRRGTVHALLGENGAGKTTLMRITFGLLSPDEGVLRVDGQVRRFRSPSDAMAARIGMVHQHFMLVPAMTVVENIALGMRGRYDAAHLRTVVQTVSMRTGLAVDPDALVGTLSVETQQRVEILKALTRAATTLILDEPTAVLAPPEARALLQNMRTFVGAGGSVVLITHKLRDALEFADEVTVLRRGRTVRTAATGNLDERTLAAAMIGPTARNDIGEDIVVRDGGGTGGAQQARGSSPPGIGERIFRLHDVVVRDGGERRGERLRAVSLQVHAGEILGIVAVEGNGQHELLRVLAKRLPVASGVVETPDDVGFIPEDRQRDALILDFTLAENVALCGAGKRKGRISWRRLYEATTALMARYDVRARSAGSRARTLSGGNQQKLVVGRELEGAPRALVAENPTRGLDVQATAAVHQRLREAKQRGAAVVFYSSDLDEVLAIADRTIVVFDGAVYDVPPDREQVGRAMLGVMSGTPGRVR